ncbi:hypothetical protein BJ970_006802 [Saccharopolyspora phatthalungensis]|uniref:Uncharacterized protein n=1 Tax=Saccharopolyspora phatthalungensis TaxID=664693 RepID=A0A840QKQ8_9PSEU|nr:hypothetical protein [Saccharopolyspora phatthalungensis]MBB5159203.1 hypothetical protein [Saccharopolyspora phatthalungensis]
MLNQPVEASFCSISVQNSASLLGLFTPITTGLIAAAVTAFSSGVQESPSVTTTDGCACPRRCASPSTPKPGYNGTPHDQDLAVYE